MALQACVECGKQVSDVAVQCPHCGYKDPGPAQDLAATVQGFTYTVFGCPILFFSIAFVIALLNLVAWMFGCPFLGD